MTVLSPSLRKCENMSIAAPPSARSGWLASCALIVVLLAGAAIRMHDLGQECFDEDELYAVRIQGASLHSLGALLGRDAFHTNHPPLMSVPFLYWNAVFGTKEAAVRALPLLCGLAAVFLIYRIGLRLGGPGAAILAALLLAINPLHIAYSREARQYTIFVTLTLAAHLFFLRCLEKGGRGNRIVYSVLVMVDLLTHYFAVPALAAHGIVALWLTFRGTPSVRRNAVAALLTLVLGIIPFVAWLPGMHAQALQPSRYHLRMGTVVDILQCLQEVQGLGVGLSAAAIAAGVLAALLAGLGFWGWRHDDVPCSGTDIRSPLPPWAAMILLVGGLLAARSLYVAAPTYILPTAEATLQEYGYDAETITRELALLRLELMAFGLAAAACGGLLLAWSGIIRLFDRLPCLGWPSQCPVSVAGMVAALIFVPLILVRGIALLGIPFLTSRNMLVLAPLGCLAIALGLEILLRQKTGRVLAALSLLGFAASACQYEPIASLWGGQGFAMEMRTAPWRSMAERLSELPDDTPLLVHKNPGTDPALFYLASYHPRRVDSVSELPQQFRFLHLERNGFCKEFLDALRAQGAAFKLLSQDGALVLYEVRMDGSGNHS